MNPQIILTAIAPVMLILALGYAAGKHQSFTQDQSRGLSQLALHYALPAALFLGMAHFNRQLLLEQGPIVVIMLVGYSLFFLLAYWLLRRMGMDKIKATLIGYAVNSTAAPIYGLTVLVPIYGQTTGTGIVGLAALVTNLAQVSVVIFMLQTAAAANNKAGQQLSLGASITQAMKNPLVWCPVAGAVFALSGLNLSPVASAALNPLAVSASGVAIFACGLALASYPLKAAFSRTSILAALVCMLVQPALFFLMIKGWGLSTPMAHAAFVAAAMPTSTPSVLFAQQYRTCESEMAGIMLITTVGMVLSLPISLMIAAYL
ncbi:MAG: AEC family transporter [Burkholderiaceae bacterium]